MMYVMYTYWKVWFSYQNTLPNGNFAKFFVKLVCVDWLIYVHYWYIFSDLSYLSYYVVDNPTHGLAFRIELELFISRKEYGTM